jgi:transglutaminase-like putative cysteine protease
MSDTGNRGEPNKSISAKDCVRMCPHPDWVNPCPFVEDFKSPGGAQITYLLTDNQIHAERHEVFVHQVIRLETMEAVQHWSQWRLQFEPKRQLVSLHSLKIRRNKNEIDQCNLEKAHFLQREEGLERFVIHGWFTLLMVLEDVRPGDILDFAYTIESSSEIFPNHGGHFFTLPQGFPVGKYRYAVQFADGRQRKWKSSAPNLTPVVTQNNGMTLWEWAGENFFAPKPEANTPSWHVGHQWIQVSDFSDWQIIAKGVSEMWIAATEDPGLVEAAQKIATDETSVPRLIDRAIRLVQDECRYLSINLEFGGQVPSPPGEVLRRRFGDCKDLSFLLCNLLGKLGVRARPILVNTFLRKSVRNFLPMPSLFNHAIVEIVSDGKRRWIDTTFKEQGGGAFNRFIPDYVCGLPVDPEATALMESPNCQISNLYDWHEHILLDSKGGTSLMAVTQHCEGNQADQLRYQLKRQGVDEWSKQRLQAMAKRHRSARRTGEIKYHDERDANVFVVAEVFEIEFQLAKHADPGKCGFTLPGNWLMTVLPLPPKGERSNPFLLPYPCQINYVSDIDNRGIKYLKLKQPRVDIGNDFAVISRTDRVGFGHFTMRLALETKADEVKPESIHEHAAFVMKMAETFNRVLNLARGYPRPATPPRFGELPSRIQPKPTFTPVSQKPSEPMSPVIRKHSLTDKIRQHGRLIWIISIILFWIVFLIIVAISNGCSH